MVVGGVVAALALWAAYGPATRALRDYRISKAYAEAMKAHPGLADFPLRLEIDHEEERVVLRGLSADESEPQALLDAIAPAALPYRVERDVKTVAATESVRMEGLKAQARLARLQSQLEQSTASLDRLRAERGVARDKLAIVPRSTLAPIAESGVGAARSRRVAFERAYDGEFGIR
jgi:hypothetical protein